MKDGKPEVVAWLCEYEGIAGDHSFTSHTSEKTVRKVPPDFGEPEPLIRLSDHEAVVSDLHKSIQRMIDQTTPLVPDPNDPKWSRRIQIDDLMAQVAELKSLLDDCRESAVDCENYAHDEVSDRRVQHYRDQIARIDAALSK